MPTVELVSFTATPEYLTDPEKVSIPIREVMKRHATGLRSLHYGIQTEDGTKGCVAVEWDSLAHHKELMESEAYVELLDAFAAVFDSEGGPFVMQHIEIPAERRDVLRTAFAGPTTEVLVATPKPETDRGLFEGGMDTFLKPFENHAVWGRSVEFEGDLVIFVGWASVQAHYETVQSMPDLLEKHANFMESFERKAYHVDFKKLL